MSFNQDSSNQFTRILALIYLAVLAWIILLKFGVEFSYRDARSITWIPFPELFTFDGKIDLSQIILNILIFLPFGIYLQVLYPKKPFLKKLLYCFLLSFFLEASQYIFKIGALDTTDLITNTAGGFLGLGLVKILQIWTGNPLRVQKTIDVLASLGTILIVTLLVLLKLDMLPIRYQ
ncbi:VanZ like protein [Algoriphagus boseongensis]|uniref:VanZ like protein n=1 Tax=Algoriphagus boseongensis TaxID=1442587 RepID=A0A4R6T683_9BACT|nr:VanZ family protein [Algoriphagus boseongensis]TDQ16428.1 VanZ like protein [Algoriphagus boseongensis]